MIRRLAIVVLLLASPGCYLLHLAKGQLAIAAGKVPIDEVIEAGDRPEAELEKLRTVLAARRFGIEHCGLKETGAYTTIYETPGRWVAWNVSASEPDAFVPYTWSFPIVGTIPYKGWFAREPAVAEALELRREGLDALVLPVAAYSTLGWFDDPFFAGLLREDEGSIVGNIVLHEMTHTTVYSSDADWNENVATFVGHEGARRFFLARGGPNDPGLRQLEHDIADSVSSDAELRGVQQELWKVYESSGPRDMKLAIKGAMISTYIAQLHVTDAVERSQPEARRSKRSRARERARAAQDEEPSVPLNNAYLLMAARYTGDQELFAGVLRACGNDLPAMIAVLRHLGRQPDPRDATEAFVRGEAAGGK